MTIKTTAHRQPNFLILLTFFAGVLATGLVQAAQPQDAAYSGQKDREAGGGEQWRQSSWGQDLAGKLKAWRRQATSQDDAEGFNVARPFGQSGPTIQCSSSLPDSVRYSLRTAGDNQAGTVGTDTDIFVFLQKRW
jgi:hypothetical protein